MIKIAVTGGIGSGKSYISHLLENMHIPVYNADNEAKRLTAVSYTHLTLPTNSLV